MIRTRTTLVAAVVAAGLALSACGANTPTAAPPTAPPTASAATDTPTVDPTVTPPPSTTDTPPVTTTDTPAVAPPPPAGADTNTPAPSPTAPPVDPTAPAPPPFTHAPTPPAVPVTHAPPVDPAATPPPAAPQPASVPQAPNPAPAPAPAPAPPVAAAPPRPAPVVQAPPPPPAPVVQVDARSACQRALDARPGWTSGAMASGWGLSCVDRLSIPSGSFAEGATSAGRRIIEVRQGISYQDAAYSWAHESGHAYDWSVMTQAARNYVTSQVGGDWPRGMTSSGPYLQQVQEAWGDSFARCGGWGSSSLGYRQIPCSVVNRAEAIAQGR